MPRFSIVVPAYNAEETLAETLDAVLAQTLDDWECVVVNDGSVDGTEALAESYAARDPRFRVVSQENRGSAGAYNTGVSEAAGEFVVLCSADDVLLHEHLASMSGFIDEQPGFDIYSSNGYFWRPEAGVRELVYDARRRGKIESLTLSDVITRCFYSVGAAYRREWFDRVGGYRTDVFGEDYDFWLRAMAQGAKHRYLPQALSLHRVSATQKSANLERAYLSDIALVTHLRDTASLSPEESAAVDATVAERRRLIAGIGSAAPRSVRSVVRGAAIRVLGRQRVERLISRIRGSRGR